MNEYIVADKIWEENTTYKTDIDFDTVREVSILSVIYNHRGIFGFAVGAIAMTILSIFIYNQKYGEVATEGAIIKEAFSKVEHNNKVCLDAVEDNKAQNAIIEAHVPKYLEKLSQTLTPRKQKVVAVEEEAKKEAEVTTTTNN